ncbi:MAG: patatin-like phospholipase family protein [Proteobacteria bacterium]|nr:patatin-like phospholipase family protein [Pseudomonadota bacterium]
MVVLAGGCAGTVREPSPLAQASGAVPPGFSAEIRFRAETRRRFTASAVPLFERVRSAAAGPLNILALSGGGAGAAFGAGALVGWSRSGQRPEFQIVTGVSAGALIAPFAFLGPAWDGELRRAFSGDATRGLLRRRWLGGLLGGSLYRGRPLTKLVDRFVTAQLLRAIADANARGRLLLVGTTDLDTAQTVIWNLGAIAAQGGEAARRLIRDVLVASASIPGVFPPVLIPVTAGGRAYQEMHVDGGTTGSLFVAPEVALLVPDALTALQGATVYVIANTQFADAPETVRPRTLAILRRSVAAALQSDSRAAVETAASLADRLRMAVRVTEIPTGYPFRGPLDLAPPVMRQLFDFGARCGTEGRLWASPGRVIDWAERPTAPGPGGGGCPAE